MNRTLYAVCLLAGLLAGCEQKDSIPAPDHLWTFTDGKVSELLSSDSAGAFVTIADTAYRQAGGTDGSGTRTLRQYVDLQYVTRGS